MSQLIVFNDSTFNDELQKSTQPVLVDFYAPWCGPCQALTPVLEELAAEYEGRFAIAKINIDDNKAIPSRFGVRSVPTMIFFKNGQEARRIVGLLPKSELKVIMDHIVK